jgi:hypothetical protein
MQGGLRRRITSDVLTTSQFRHVSPKKSHSVFVAGGGCTDFSVFTEHHFWAVGQYTSYWEPFTSREECPVSPHAEHLKPSLDINSPPLLLFIVYDDLEPRSITQRGAIG